ncbi:hypothetical protein [Cerasicoccus frondis]|uniref:hypothetical protein n=1 Tax=Cerasicoccus frondis TaxID=490090 RepID=UPI00285284D8|nr:hypothetical protein [Cerasicoccus frondis]
MKTNRRSALSGWAKIFAGVRIVGVIACLAAAYFLALTFHLVPRFERDALGNRPRDVVDQYVELCRAGQFEAAEKLWSAGSVAYVNQSYLTDGFNGVCQEIAMLDLNYHWASYGNTKDVVHLQARDGSQEKIRNFYFVQEAGVWRLDWPR